MISLVRGTIVERGSGSVVVDTGGVGYEVFVHGASSDRIGDVGSQVTLRTFLDVREGALDLYGFLERDELAVFKVLIGASRVGPRLALKVLSTLTPREVVRAIQAQDAEPFEQVSGLGTETAKRLLVELAKKVKKLELESPAPADGGASSHPARALAESVLRNLGYRSHEIEKSLDWAMQSFPREPTLEELIKKALAFFHKS
jgi:Holliday junction DNA helicase RuvA